MIKYNLLSDNGHGFTSCYEAAVNSILYNHYEDYFLIYSMFWGFSYVQASQSNLSLKDRFKVGGRYQNSYDYCNDIFELKLTEKYSCEVDRFLKELKDELNGNKVVILTIDTFNCRWNAGFNKYHLEHYLVITGYNGQDGIVNCQDPFSSKQDEIITIRDIHDMVKIKYYTYEINRNSESRNGTKELRLAADIYLNKERSYDKILEFSQELKSLNLFEELKIENLSLIALDPFFVKFKGVIASRYDILFLCKQLKDQRLHGVIGYLNQICDLLYQSFLLLIKGMTRRGDKILTHSAADALCETAVIEKKAVELLI